MSIPVDELWRGCSSAYSEPLTEEEKQTAVSLVDMLVHSNPGFTIEFRVGLDDHDRIHHVFRWTSEPIVQIFRDGFEARNVHNTPEEIYYNLEHYVNHAGEPIYERSKSFAFISTTADSGWQPTLSRGTDPVYRYEIYAPGGIFVAETLGAACRFPNQAEVTFVGGIAPKYIRSAQRFFPRQAGNSGHPLRLERENHYLFINHNFNPRPEMLLGIQRPVLIYFAEPGKSREPLIVVPDIGGQVPADLDWYATSVGNTERWISAAFRSSKSDEAYVFMDNEYVLINYAPGTTSDWVVNGPLPIYEAFPSLACTVFAEWGIDCSFRSHHGDEAFIFCGNLCAHIDFAPHTTTTDDKILQGPMTIARMFPFFKGTVFEKGIDAAFESSATDEAYLFKGDQYALINYHAGSAKLITIRPINQGFHSFIGTIFESGIHAAFASSRTDEAYLFKGDSYARINFAPGTTDNRLLGGVRKILHYWPSFHGLLPRKNQGDDVRA